MDNDPRILALSPQTRKPMECQAACAKLQWTHKRLAREAGVAVDAVAAFELEQGSPHPELVAALTGALEAAETNLPANPTPPRRSASSS